MASYIIRGFLLVLGVAAILVAAQAWLDWKDENNTRPMDRILSAEQLHALPAPEDAVQPVLVQLNTDQFTLVNPTRFPIHYTGYTIHSFDKRPARGQISPFYQMHVQDENGQWLRIGRGFCGTGSDTLAVLPGHAGLFNVHINGLVQADLCREGHLKRVGIVIWRGDPQVTETIWSEPFRQ